MFGTSFKLFDVLGFRVGAHWSLLLALVFAGFTYGGLVQGLTLSALLFGSILAHELGHAVVARKLSVPISGIDLHFFGGLAKMAAPPRSPQDEIKIALAGPAVSAVLAVLAYGLWSLTHAGVLLWLASANLALLLFNLLPALPLDGGRVLRALLATKRGFVRGTSLAVKTNRVLAVALAGYGLYSGSWWLCVLAVLVWSMGTQELATATRHQVLTHMGAWHPAHVPWAGYDRASRAPAPTGGSARSDVLEPDFVDMPLRRRES